MDRHMTRAEREYHHAIMARYLTMTREPIVDPEMPTHPQNLAEFKLEQTFYKCIGDVIHVKRKRKVLPSVCERVVRHEGLFHSPCEVPGGAERG